MTTQGWRTVHLGFADDGLELGGIAIWRHKWRPTGEERLDLPHPGHPNETHKFDVFVVGEAGPTVRFAAAELSNGVWGFYVPNDSQVDSSGLSADGSLRFEHRVNDHADQVPARAVLIDAATDQVLVDCADWASSRIVNRPDGDLDLRLQQNGLDVLFRIGPARRLFCNYGERGPDRPLFDLADAVEEERRMTDRFTPDPGYRRISPNGAIRVDLATAEWANSHWVNSPRVVETATGKVVLDLRGTDWDADVSFPRSLQVRLDFRRYYVGGALTAVIDLQDQTYQIVSEGGRDSLLPPAPLAEIVAGLEAASRRAAALDPTSRARTLPQGRTATPPAWTSWRAALVILVGAALAIAGATVVTIHLDGSGSMSRGLRLAPTVPTFNELRP